ncbi:MAG: DinB family protein [Candidatus Hodarchaeales archaeon]
MDYDTRRQKLVELVQIERAHGYRMLEGLTPDQLIWRPEGTRARTIHSYFRHVINAEIYWLKKLGDTKFDYFPREASFDDLMDNYKQLGKHIIDLIDNLSEEELIPRAPDYKGEELQQKHNVAWIVWRTSLHAIHHYGQIAHIRYSIENPPSEDPVKTPFIDKNVTWGNAVDVFIPFDSSKE